MVLEQALENKLKKLFSKALPSVGVKNKICLNIILYAFLKSKGEHGLVILPGEHVNV